MEKLQSLHTVGGNINEKRYESSSKKIKIELSYDPAMLLLGTYPKEMKSDLKDI